MRELVKKSTASEAFGFTTVEAELPRLQPMRYGDTVLPAVGKKFGFEPLPEVPKRVFSRVAEIYGRSVLDFLPVRDFDLGPEREWGICRANTNSIALKTVNVDSFEADTTLEHELIHSALNPVNPNTRDILLAGERQKQIASRRGSLLGALKHLRVDLFMLGRIMVSKDVDEGLAIEGTASTEIAGRRYRNFRRFLRRYGADGMILLSAEAPRNIRNPTIRRVEEKYLSQGLLQKAENPGQNSLTPRGEEYVREKVPPKTVDTYLRVVEKNRRETFGG